MRLALQNRSYGDPRNVILPGQVFDGQAGLHQNYFRDYDPATGRYVESDPIGLTGGINPYAYVDDSPTSEYDANGLEAVPYLPSCRQLCTRIYANRRETVRTLRNDAISR
jgi:RHS repeat-associated protein